MKGIKMKQTTHWHYVLWFFGILLISTCIGQFNIPASVDFIISAITGFALLIILVQWIFFAIKKNKK